MILDTSAILGIIYGEADEDELVAKIDAAASVSVGAPTLLEAAIVLGGKHGDHGQALLLGFVERTHVTVVPFEEVHYRAAVDAWLRFGSGRHPARLEFGDCLAYAVAKVADEPLLCKGGDFAQTDVELA